MSISNLTGKNIIYTTPGCRLIDCDVIRIETQLEKLFGRVPVTRVIAAPHDL